MARRSDLRRLNALEAVQAASIVLAVVAGTFVAGAGSTAQFRCTAFPRCLWAPSDPLALVHTGSAGALLLLVGAGLLLAVGVRRSEPALVPWTSAAFVLLLAMAALGGAFATGAIPSGLATIQILLLGILVATLAVGMLRTRAAARRATGSMGPAGDSTT